MVKQGIQIFARAKPTKQKLAGVSFNFGMKLSEIIINFGKMLEEDVVKFNDVVYVNFGIMTENLFGDSPLNKVNFFVTDIFVYSLWQLAG